MDALSGRSVPDAEDAVGASADDAMRVRSETVHLEKNKR